MYQKRRILLRLAYNARWTAVGQWLTGLDNRDSTGLIWLPEKQHDSKNPPAAAILQKAILRHTDCRRGGRITVIRIATTHDITSQAKATSAGCPISFRTHATGLSAT